MLASCSAQTRTMPREVFGPPVPTEAKASLIAAIVARAATGQHLKNRVNNLYNEMQQDGARRAAGGMGLGGRAGSGGMSMQQRLGLLQRPAGEGLAGQKRRSPDGRL
jgi:hypothetical protein